MLFSIAVFVLCHFTVVASAVGLYPVIKVRSGRFKLYTLSGSTDSFMWKVEKYYFTRDLGLLGGPLAEYWFVPLDQNYYYDKTTQPLN